VSIKRTLWAPTIASSTVGTGQSLAFTLNALPSYAEFTSLFEFYRICAVKVTFLPRQTDFATQTVSNLWTVIDYNDVTAPTSNTQMQQYSAVKLHSGFKPFTMYLKPRVAMPVWQGLSSSGYAPGKANQWLDCNSPAIQHYGIKMFWDTLQSGTTMDITATYYMQFKGAN